MRYKHMKVYDLSHVRNLEPGVTTSLQIGIYTSLEIVNTKILKYKNIVGFKDYTNGFVVKAYDVIGGEETILQSGQPVYFLQHEYSVNEGGIIYDYVTKINIYADYETASKEVCFLVKEGTYPQAPDGLYAPDGFYIDKYILDKDGWEDGFVTY